MGCNVAQFNDVPWILAVCETGPFAESMMKSGPASTSVKVPPEFLRPGRDCLFETLAIEKGRNQTITEGTFTTMP